MNKQDLVDAVAKRLGITKARAAEITELFFAPGRNHRVRAEAGREGGDLRLRQLRDSASRAAREGRNPRTGKAITLKASTAPAFRAGQALKDLVNRKR